MLYGLPWLLTGTILAHECMHAWLRLRGITRLPLQTEEGLCQLMGLLWLESQDLSKHQVSSTNKHLIYPCSRHSSACMSMSCYAACVFVAWAGGDESSLMAGQ